jgi:hypothetical protein
MVCRALSTVSINVCCFDSWLALPFWLVVRLFVWINGNISFAKSVLPLPLPLSVSLLCHLIYPLRLYPHTRVCNSSLRMPRHSSASTVLRKMSTGGRTPYTTRELLERLDQYVLCLCKEGIIAAMACLQFQNTSDEPLYHTAPSLKASCTTASLFKEIPSSDL